MKTIYGEEILEVPSYWSSEPKDRPMTVYIAIQEIELDTLEMEIDDLCQFLQSFTTDYNHPIKFDSIRFKNISCYIPNIGEFEEKWYITGVRKETPEEFDLRLLKIKEEAAKELELKEKRV